MTSWTPTPTLPHVFAWESQVSQYPEIGPPGISVFEGWVDGLTLPILCLCWRDANGKLHGVLNYYQEDSLWETKGNANLWVDPACQRQGIGRALLLDAISRWHVDLTKQRYTREGAAFVEAVLNNR